MSLAHHWEPRELTHGLTKNRQVRTIVKRGVDSGLVVRERCGDEVCAGRHAAADVLDGHAVGHDEGVALGPQVTHGLLEGATVRTRAIRGVDGHDVGTGVHAGNRVAQGRRDVDALVPLLPQADDGNLDAALDGSNVRKALAADGRRPSQLTGARHLGNGLRVAQRLAWIGLDAHDELALERLDQRIHRHGTPLLAELGIPGLDEVLGRADKRGVAAQFAIDYGRLLDGRHSLAEEALAHGT